MQRQRDSGKRLISFRLLFGILISCPLVVVLYSVYNQHFAKNSSVNAPIREVTLKEVTLEEVFQPDSAVPPIASNVLNNIAIKKKIAYAITVTKDGPFLDGALVLGHAAKKSHDASSKYDADLVAFVAPSVVTARPILEAYGWRVLERHLPVELSEIVNRDYADKMKNSGCCGADEFLKLWAYTLVEYHRVVHLDMDSIVFKNMVNFDYIWAICTAP